MGPRPAPRSQAARGGARSPYPGRPRLPKIVLDRAARHPRRTPDLPRAYAVVVQSQIYRNCHMVSSLLAGIKPSSMIEGA